MNSTAAYVLSKLCETIIKKMWGNIIYFNFVTLNGIVEGYVPYLASKGAMLGLTSALASEIRPYMAFAFM